MTELGKKLLVSLMAASAILSLTSCNTAENKTTSQVEESSAAETVSSESSADESSVEAQEPYTVKILMCGDAETSECEKVAKAATEITGEKFNTTIELVRFGYGTYGNQQNLMLSSGEKLDLMTSMGLTPTTGANNGQILPLDDLLAEYGQDILADISEADWACTSVDGQIYGVRNNKELASGSGYAMSTEILEQLDFDVSTLKTEDDMADLFRLVKEKFPDVYPLVSEAGAIGYSIARYDELGGDFGVLEDATTDSTTVVNKFACDTFREMAERRYQWAKEGLIMPDASTNPEFAWTLIGAGKGFSYLCNTKPGIEGEIGRQAGVDITVVQLIEPYSVTSHLSNQWYIPYNSEKPERAMQVLNEMYSNPDLANIFVNGVEGEHYVVVDQEQGIIDYPEGVTSTETGYAISAWAWPNELITYTWKMDGPTLWKDTIAFNESATPSIAKGFVWNNEKVLPEIAACNNVKAKYENAINCGELDPAEALPMFNDELEKAGIQAIIDEKQAQLDAWLANK